MNDDTWHEHKTKFALGGTWQTCVFGPGCDKKAHGGVSLTEYCFCGATRKIESHNGITRKGSWVLLAPTEKPRSAENANYEKQIEKS